MGSVLLWWQAVLHCTHFLIQTKQTISFRARWPHSSITIKQGTHSGKNGIRKTTHNSIHKLKVQCLLCMRARFLSKLSSTSAQRSAHTLHLFCLSFVDFSAHVLTLKLSRHRHQPPKVSIKNTVCSSNSEFCTHPQLPPSPPPPINATVIFHPRSN